MKIILQGKIPEKQLHRCICMRCKTLFEFERGEAKFIADQRDGDMLKIDCPFCRQPCYADVHKSKFIGGATTDEAI